MSILKPRVFVEPENATLRSLRFSLWLRDKLDEIDESRIFSLSSLDKLATNSPALTKAEHHIHTLIHHINNGYRKAYENQKFQQIQERQLRMMKDRGVERV